MNIDYGPALALYKTNPMFNKLVHVIQDITIFEFDKKEGLTVQEIKNACELGMIRALGKSLTQSEKKGE